MGEIVFAATAIFQLVVFALMMYYFILAFFGFKRKTEKKNYTPMMMQYLKVKEQYEDTIILYRLGDFYEMFFEDAIKISRELELTLTGKSCGLDERVPMCGVPHHSYLPYLEKLVNKGYKVAICEQLTDPNQKGMVERGVVQVVTKGTRIDAFLNEKDSNYSF